MANKQIIDYIKQAQDSKLNKAEIIQNLKTAGWSDDDIRDGFAYINLYTEHPLGYKKDPKPERGPIVHDRLAWVAICLGYLWLISGLNKILGGLFVPGFPDFVRNQIENGQAWPFYKNILSSVVLPNANLIAPLIQFSELGIGAVLILLGFWNFLSVGFWRNFVLCLASIASFVMILNIILSLGLPFPWIDKANAFAQGVSLEYFILFLSLVLGLSYFSEV
ncbi:MAG: hypothetical protein KW788_04630 [Candidatus Doudnabacteria bacterium]|nr:hypothetical protein [Candidatus Doudnabacteria bacterium]